MMLRPVAGDLSEWAGGYDDAGLVLEYLNLVKGVLPRGRIQNENNIVRSGRVDLLHHADDLFEFAHQFRTVLQPARRIHEQNVDAFGGGARQRVEESATASRFAIDCRFSNCRLPLPRPISTFALPSLK